MARMDPTKKANKWQGKMQGAQQDYTDGIAAVDTAPGVLAAAKQDTLRQRFNQSIDDGTWANAVSSVPLTTWQNQAKTIGGPRLADGAKKGYPKVQKYFQAAAPIYDQIRSQIRAMPNATEAQRQARYQASQELMKQLKGISKR